MTQRPIAVFDSGVGGLSVWREMVRQLPNEATLYVADQAHIPYGPRPLEEIRRYAEGITRFVLAQGAKLVVVACNTASGAALTYLRQTFPDVPFVGMEPAVKPAVEHTQRGIVGVIATPATFQGELFRRLVARYAGSVQVLTQTCPGLVERVEAGELNTPETRAALESFLRPMIEAGVDQLVLGCTHYPFLSDAIAEVVGAAVTLIDPAPAVARQVGRVLEARGERAPDTSVGHHHFYTTGDAQALAEQAQRLVGYQGAVTALQWDETGRVLRA